MTCPPRLAAVADLMASTVVLAGATASGALLFAIAQGGYASFPDLVKGWGVAGALAVVVAAVAARIAAGPRLLRAVAVGAVAGIVGTGGLELVREIGFRQFHSMPGDIAMLMGVLLTNRIMDGPDTTSNLAGWADHVWNGAMFGVIFAVLVGGFPRLRRGVAVLAGIGYGLLLGTGFLLSPVPVAIGAGRFGADFGPRFAVTVYLAHALFGAITAWLVNTFGTRVEPLWTVALKAGRG